MAAPGAASTSTRAAGAADSRPLPKVERLSGNPIIRPEMLPGKDGENINGPSLIRVPDWIEKPLGRYYLYFAHHQGKYIRMAYADDLAGPWRVHEPGVLALAATVCDDIPPAQAKKEHIASPDVQVDDQSRQIRLYFHCPVYKTGDPDDGDSYPQSTLLALSSDGLRFVARPEVLAPAYLRVFRWQGAHYGFAQEILCRSTDGLRAFERGPAVLPESTRHVAVRVDRDTLWVFFTRVGDAPEHIVVSTIDLAGPWREWRATEPVTLLEPAEPWEGALLPLAASKAGKAGKPRRQLRDPAIYEEDGSTWLLYAVAGESGIAIARLQFP